MSIDPQWLIGILLAVIFALLGLVHRSMSTALDTKASADALKEAKSYFHRELERLHTEYTERVRELAARQDREIDTIRHDMARVTDSLDALRRDVTEGNKHVLEQLQAVALQLRTR